MKKTPKWKLFTIGINQIIIDDSKFNWFPNPLSKNDSNSILNHGIQLPILVQEIKESKYNLVDGFKRLKWLKSAKSHLPKEKINENINCLVIPRSFSLLEVVMIRVNTLSNSEKNFSGARVCSLLIMLQKNGFTKNDIVNFVLPQLGIESSPRLASQLIDMGNILIKLREEKQFCFSEFFESLSFEDLITLHKFIGKSVIQVLNFAAKMEVRGKKLRNILQILDEVSRFQEIPAKEILELRQFKDILRKKNLQIPERYRLIKEQLNLIRYPKLNVLRKKFIQTRESLNLPEKISLEYDNSFEEENMVIKLEFSNLDELKNHIKFLEIKSTEKGYSGKGFLWERLFSLLR